ncbi:HPP family protein [Massilia cavernae]|nr:HPP family protein [Massilia cavernae]
MLWLRGFVPQPVLAPWRERAVACLGACAGLLFTAWFSRLTFGEANPWFIAPMGASAVLLFAVPASPLAQPWSVIGGNLVSALIGVACASLVPDKSAAAALAVALAICAMFALRCLHPPGGAVAFTAVMGGPAVHELGYRFALSPVTVNSLFLVAAALVLNNLLRHHRYPHPAYPPGNRHGATDRAPAERLGFNRADLDAALKDHDELLDVSEYDLEQIFRDVELRAWRRRSGGARCKDIMARDVIVARPEMTPAGAWMLLDRHELRALPVVNEHREIVGIITLRDLIASPDANPPQLVTQPFVSDVMSRGMQVTSPEQTVAELVPLFSDEGFHHLPVVDASRRVVGMVTQSDIIAAMFRDKLESAGRA